MEVKISGYVAPLYHSRRGYFRGYLPQMSKQKFLRFTEILEF